MLEQIKNANWKKQTVEVTSKHETFFQYEGTPCRVYMAQYGDAIPHCGGRWNVQVSVGDVWTSGIVDTSDAGMEYASRILPHLYAAHAALKGC